MPTKALLNSVKIYYSAKSNEQFGVTVSGLEYNLNKAMEWKNKTLATFVKGVDYQRNRHNVNVVSGLAQIEDRNIVIVGG